MTERDKSHSNKKTNLCCIAIQAKQIWVYLLDQLYILLPWSSYI